MFFWQKRISLVLLLFSLINPSLVLADTGASETEELKKEIVVLKERLNALEARLQQSEIKTAAIFNTNAPVPPNARTNALCVFDTEANGFMLNMAEINFEKPISQESPLGFRIDLDYGRDARLIHSNGLGNAGDEFDLEQAYAQVLVPFRLPLMNALNFKIGKFVTLHSAEVIESVDNWNFSRSYLFGFAIPFTHTGIRAYYKPFENVPIDSYIGVVNGWDQVVDLNKVKTIEAQVTITPLESLSLAVGGHVWVGKG